MTGVGAADGVRVVRWRPFRRILAVWVLTPIVCGAVAAMFRALAG